MEIYERKSISMFVMILEKSPNFEDRGGECSPPLLYKFFSLEPSVREAWEFLLAEMLKNMQKTEILHDS